MSVLAKGVLAAHPLVTDDTFTQGLRNNQIELNTDRYADAGNVEQLAAFTYTYTYGAGETIDLFVNQPGRLSRPAGPQDLSVGAKWRIWQRNDTALAVKPELSLPTGDPARGLGTGRAGAALTLLTTISNGPWTVHANAGMSLARYRDPAARRLLRSRTWRASAAVTYAAADQWTILADTGVAQNPDRNSRIEPAFFLIGAIFSPHADLDLDIGVKAALDRRDVPFLAKSNLAHFSCAR